MKYFGPAAAALVLVAGCAPQGRSAPASAALPDGLPTRELMAHVIDPAADGVWDRQGWEVTAKGEKETFPSTEEGWLEAENAAAAVAASANLLLTPGRIQAGEGWARSAQALHLAGLDAFRAAEARDKQAFFDAGGRIYAACAGCHEQYLKSPPEVAEAGGPQGRTGAIR